MVEKEEEEEEEEEEEQEEEVPLEGEDALRACLRVCDLLNGRRMQ